MIETSGTDSKPKLQYAKPDEYLNGKEKLMGELASFLSHAGGVPREKLAKIKVERSIPWQEQIIADPQARLRKTGAGGIESLLGA